MEFIFKMLIRKGLSILPTMALRLCTNLLIGLLFLCFVMLGVLYQTPVQYMAPSSVMLPHMMDSKVLLFSPEDRETLEHAFPYAAHPFLISYIRQHLLMAPSSGPHSFTITGSNSSYNATDDLSQTGISTYIDDLLQGRTGGFYVDVGAFDGLQMSKSLFFELHRGWSGLLIEPNPTQFEHLLLKHRRALAVNVAASPTTSTGKYYFFLDQSNSGLATFPSKVLHRPSPRVTIVQAMPLFSLILAANRTRVDYLALNVAGTELEILKTIPFHLLTFDVISVGYRRQYNYTSVDPDASRAQLNAIRAFFKGYSDYWEVGFAPVVNPNNRTESEGHGCDVVYAYRTLARTNWTQAAHW